MNSQLSGYSRQSHPIAAIAFMKFPQRAVNSANHYLKRRQLCCDIDVFLLLAIISVFAGFIFSRRRKDRIEREVLDGRRKARFSIHFIGSSVGYSLWRL